MLDQLSDPQFYMLWIAFSLGCFLLVVWAFGWWDEED